MFKKIIIKYNITIIIYIYIDYLLLFTTMQIKRKIINKKILHYKNKHIYNNE